MRKGALLASLRTLVAAFALAVLIWYIARNELTGEDQAEVQIQVVNPENVRVVDEDGGAPHLRVTLTGPILPLQRVRDAFQRQEIVGRIQLTAEQKATGGLVAVPLSESIFQPPPDPRVRMRLDDREIRLRVTPITSRRLPVSLDTDLDHTRFRLRVMVPREVTVRGPRDLLDRLTEVKTVPLRLAKIADAGRPDFEANLEIAKVIDGERIECDEPPIYVHVVFGEETVVQEFKDVAVHVCIPPDFPYEVRIVEPEQRRVAVTVQGRRSVLLGNPQFVGQIDVYLKIDNPRIYKPSATPYLLERRCRLPEGVSLVSVSGPEKVSVDILERKPAAPP